jgi:hypothetical protein
VRDVRIEGGEVPDGILAAVAGRTAGTRVIAARGRQRAARGVGRLTKLDPVRAF